MISNNFFHENMKSIFSILYKRSTE